VVTGFLGGIAIHIAASQMPIVLGVDIAEGELPARIFDILIAIPQANWISVAIGLSVLVVMLILERINPRVPSALLAIAAATALVQVIGPKTLGIATLGSVSPFPPGFALPPPSTLTTLIPLALLLTLVIIMQVSAVDRAFPGDGDTDVNKDFVGVAAGNFLSAAFGAFPINASPPRTAVAVEAGAMSQMGALVAAALVLALAFWGGGLLGSVPNAALAGILLFVAVRLFRLPTLIDIARRAPSEAALALLTFLAIVTLPIQSGIAVGVGLALLHGVWMIAHSPVLELKRLPGTTIWWPDTNGQTEDGVVVLAFQAPLLFANADGFKRQVLAHLGGATASRLVVLEASAIVEIDYSAARSLQEVIDICHQRGTRFVIARLVSVRASEAIDRFGIASRLGAKGMTHSVQEAIDNYQRSGR
jgi:MFS superfamily sulfate permease-like transporter